MLIFPETLKKKKKTFAITISSFFVLFVCKNFCELFNYTVYETGGK